MFRYPTPFALSVGRKAEVEGFSGRAPFDFTRLRGLCSGRTVSSDDFDANQVKPWKFNETLCFDQTRYFLVAFGVVGGVHARDIIRFDGSSDSAAKASWHRMYAHASRDEKQKLIVALIQINLAGVKNASQVASIIRIFRIYRLCVSKTKSLGMTAAKLSILANAQVPSRLDCVGIRICHCGPVPVANPGPRFERVGAGPR